MAERAPELQHLIDESQIRHLLNCYPRALDRQDSELLASLFHPDAIDDHGVFNGLAAEYVAWIRERSVPGNHWMHHNGTMLIEIEGDVANTETYTFALARAAPKEGDTRPREIFLRVRYLDRVERRGGVWKIAHRRVVYSPCHILTVEEEFPLPDADCLFEGGINSDPLYTMLKASA